MFIIEGNTTHENERSLVKVDGLTHKSSQRPGADGSAQRWNRIRERAAKSGARNRMLAWLDEMATDSAVKAGQALERAAAAAKPQLQSASRIALQAAGDLSEGLATQLMKMSKAARVAALRSMPRKRVFELVLELEREGVIEADSVERPEPCADSQRSLR